VAPTVNNQRTLLEQNLAAYMDGHTDRALHNGVTYKQHVSISVSFTWI